MIRTRIAFDYDYMRTGTVSGAGKGIISTPLHKSVPTIYNTKGSKPLIGWLPFLVSILFGDPPNYGFPLRMR